MRRVVCGFENDRVVLVGGQRLLGASLTSERHPASRRACERRRGADDFEQALGHEIVERRHDPGDRFGRQPLFEQAVDEGANPRASTGKTLMRQVIAD